MPTTTFAAIGSHVQRLYRDKRTLSVDELLRSLQGEKFEVDRQRVISALQHFEKRALGSFIVGRRGKPSRILWKAPPKDLSFDENKTVSAAGTAHPEILEYPLVLRPGLTAKILLPSDLTSAEASRIAEYIRRLPLERTASTTG